MILSWSLKTASGQHLSLLFNPDGTSGYTVVEGAAQLATTETQVDVPMSLLKNDFINGRYLLELRNAKNELLDSKTVLLSNLNTADLVGYIKASDSVANDTFGLSVELSANGNTLAVATYGENSNATGINGNQVDKSADYAGAVYVFTRTAGLWAQQAYIKASNTEDWDYFGIAMSLSADGNTLAVGAKDESSNATGINGNQADNSASDAGAAYVFTRTDGLWAQEAYIKASNTGARDSFGSSVALSADGNTLAVGAKGEGSNATGINGNQADNSAGYAGAAYVFTRTANVWVQQAYIKASNTGTDDYFGCSVALSADGNTLAVGAALEASNATGVNGNQADNSAVYAGAVYVFTRTAGNWIQQVYIKASNTGARDSFGTSVALSADGNILAVGADGESSNATGIYGNQADNSASVSGAVYVFTRAAANWAQEAYIKASNTAAGDAFGTSVTLSADGNTLAVAARSEASSAIGINTNQTDNSAAGAGAVYVFARTAVSWVQKAYIKASNTETSDYFGTSVALSADGNTLAVGAVYEDSNATGINGNQTDNSAIGAGAVYIY